MMQDISKLCMICLSVRDENNICPRCRKNIAVRQDSPLLPLKSIISERYCIAKAMKRNGEGVTYAAYDLKLNKPVSVREFFPESIASRSFDELTVVPASGSESDFSCCRASFIELWTKLMRLKGLSALITVTDVFQANSTAYAVYEETELVNLNSYLNNTPDGFMTWEKARILFMPVLSTLGTLHTSGVLHRGINPKSFIFSKDGKLKLTDFCTEQARVLLNGLEPELFDGYTPYEQYSTTGNIGAWSDIYSFCAVIYRTLIGKDPIDSRTRAQEDKLMIPAKFAELIPTYVINALINGMQIDSADRTQNIEQLRSNLSTVQRTPDAPIFTHTADRSKYVSAEPFSEPAPEAAPAPSYVPSSVPAFTTERTDNPVSSYNSYAQRMQGFQPDTTNIIPPPAEAPVPPEPSPVREQPSPETRGMGDQVITGFAERIGAYEQPSEPVVPPVPAPAPEPAKEYRPVMYAEPRNGSTPGERVDEYRLAVEEVRRLDAEKSAKKKKTVIAILAVLIVILLGACGFLAKSLLSGKDPSQSQTQEQMINVPDFKTSKIDDILSNKAYTENFTINQAAEVSETIAKGIVINQNIAPNTQVPKGTMITLYVSSGPKMTVIEDVAGLTYELAEKRLTAQGFKVSKSYRQNDGKHTANTVAETSPLAKSEVKEGSLVMIVLWKEAETTTTAVIDIGELRTTVPTTQPPATQPPTTLPPTTAAPSTEPSTEPSSAEPEPTELPSDEPVERDDPEEG